MSATTSRHSATATRRIIAVGGAKGGVGKSLLASNMGVYLATRGFRTVVIDMDLGAANLHLFLGLWSLKHSINDFLEKRVDDLWAVAVPTRYGPYLIGGGTQLGAANLPYARKLKLLRAIKKIDADYVILDLGGDTAYNVLDFFLLADYGLVVTTCDPISYLDAYTFVKLALYRRLARLFGPESQYCRFRDRDLLALIKTFVEPNQTETARKISDLLKQTKSQFPEKHDLVETALAQHQPHLVVNMVDNASEVEALVGRMQKVAQLNLNVSLPLSGTIPYSPEISRFARELKPGVGLNPYGPLARAIRNIVKNTMNSN